jgi:hypothetical protein
MHYVINGIITSSLRVLFGFAELGSKGIGILARARTTLMRDVISVSVITLGKGSQLARVKDKRGGRWKASWESVRSPAVEKRDG